MVSSKAPKSCHFSKSESLDFRIGSAVCQKNIGEKYVTMVNKEATLSPGKVSAVIGKRRDNSFLKRKANKGKLTSKRRRLELKQLRHTVSNMKEIREGVTYKSFVCLENTEENDLISIPEATNKPATQLNPY